MLKITLKRIAKEILFTIIVAIHLIFLEVFRINNKSLIIRSLVYLLYPRRMVFHPAIVFCTAKTEKYPGNSNNNTGIGRHT